MKVVMAPDKFAGTLSAAEAAAAMAVGWRRARPDDEVVEVPMADGGEGVVEVVAAAVPAARIHALEVADASGHPRQARWVQLPDGAALIEVAEAIGLSHLPTERRDALETTSYGAGQLIAAALAAGADPVVVGLGGSATNDGGIGALIAIGHELRRDDGNRVRVGGRNAATVTAVSAAPRPGARVVAATDVTNPLLGTEGATAVFGPQKGADADALAELEAALTTFADVVERDVAGGPWRDLPGAGAAGGLGFALAAFAGAELTGGAQAIADLVGLDAVIDGAGAVVTGEGSLDAQSSAGKVPVYVAARALVHGVPAHVVAGRIADGATGPFVHARDLGPEGMTRAAELVAERTEEIARAVAG